VGVEKELVVDLAGGQHYRTFGGCSGRPSKR
jgi:hypothetical protein